MRLFEGTRVLRWESWDRTGAEHCVIRNVDEDFIAEGVIIAPQSEGFAARYLIRFDARWNARAVSVAIVGSETSLSLMADAAELWHRGAEPLPALRYAIAPDLSGSALTNTFAIRRLGLREGESADIETAYIALPSLAVTADPQRYTCLETGKRYRYESRDSDFTAEIAVDEDGFVTEYPELFRRVA